MGIGQVGQLERHQVLLDPQKMSAECPVAMKGNRYVPGKFLTKVVRLGRRAGQPFAERALIPALKTGSPRPTEPERTGIDGVISLPPEWEIRPRWRASA